MSDGAATPFVTNKYRVLAFCATFDPGFRGGGPVRSMTRLVDTVSSNIDLKLITSDRDLGATEPYPGLSGCWTNRGRSLVFYLNTRAIPQWLRLWRGISREPYNLIYTNSLWCLSHTIIPILAIRFGLMKAERILIAPRGELSPGALGQKSRKKELFLWFWKPILQSLPITWHASSNQEASDIRETFPRGSVKVVTNQVTLPPQSSKHVSTPGTILRLVFISRISRMKNLLIAIQALQNLKIPVDFDIFGPIEDRRYWTECQRAIEAPTSLGRITYQGELRPADVPVTFGKYDAFLFPTKGENFGHVIAESLSASCPVICSDRTPWTEILETGGGAVVPALTELTLRREISRIAALTPRERSDLKAAAGQAYDRWQQTIKDINILDLIREARSEPRT